MSKWIEQFESHAFQTTWTNLKDALEQSTVDDETVITSVKELARLKKVTTFLDEMIHSIDPELAPLTTWDNFNSQAIPCLQKITTYNSDRNIAHIIQSNAHADNLLTYIRPYMVIEGKAGKALQTAIKKYSKTIDEYSDSFSEKTRILVDEISKTRDQSNELFVIIQEIKKIIDKFNVELFGNEEVGAGIQTKVKELVDDFENKHKMLTEYYNEILIGDEEEPSTKQSISLAKDDILSEHNKIEQLLNSVTSEVSEITQFHTKVFGDNQKRVEGLTNKLDTFFQQLKDFENTHKIKYRTLINKIESLIPGATSAGLASAYRALRKSFSQPLKLYAKLFYASITILFIISLVFVVDNAGMWYVNFIDINKPSDLLKNLLFKIPLLLPILWLAIFASKRRSEAQRLQQEYAHKEALAKSYQSFKTQIDNLEEKDSELLKKLLESAIVAISYNASETLDGKHGDKMPAQKMIEELAQILKKD